MSADAIPPPVVCSCRCTRWRRQSDSAPAFPKLLVLQLLRPTLFKIIFLKSQFLALSEFGRKYSARAAQAGRASQEAGSLLCHTRVPLAWLRLARRCHCHRLVHSSATLVSLCFVALRWSTSHFCGTAVSTRDRIPALYASKRATRAGAHFCADGSSHGSGTGTLASSGGSTTRPTL